MNIYIATSFKFRDDAAAIARKIRELDLRVVSRWHDEFAHGEDPNVAEADLPYEVLERIASGNHRDLAQANTLVLLVRPKMQGALVETGCALARGMHVLIIGERHETTVMVRHHNSLWCEDEQECLGELKRLSGKGGPTR